MLFIANAQGTILNTVPDRVYQGSNNANQVLLAIPLPSSVTIKIAYKLPNGLLTEPALMTYNEQEVEGNPLNVWSIDIPEAITTYYGTVTTQFIATNSQGVKVASGSATFEVERGVAPVLPATPTQDIYDQILQALSSIKEDIVNGWLESKTLLPYDATYSYTFGAVVFNSNNKELYKSLVEANKGNALTDTAKWQALGFEKAFSDITKLQSDLTALQNTVAQLGTDLGQLTQRVDTIDENVTQNTSDIADIESGDIVVGKATSDANGNNITNTYQTKSNLTTGWGQVLSDTKYPSERLVKTTIDGIIASGGKQSFVFDTQANFLAWIDGTFVRPDGKTVGDVNIADDILIKEQTVPDYWCSSKSEPMTIADFTEYEAKTNLTDYLAKDNTEEFTPTGDYNPATKKYVDDRAGGIGINISSVQGTLSESDYDLLISSVNNYINYNNGEFVFKYIGQSQTYRYYELATPSTFPDASHLSIRTIRVNSDRTYTYAVDNLQTKITIDTAMSDTSTNPVQNKVIKNYVDKNGVGAVTDVNLTIGQETVSYNSEDGITINSNGQIKYDEKTKDITIEHDIPIVAGNGINIDKLSDKEQVEIKAVAQYITLDVPATATNGTLTAEQLAKLQNSEIVGILFNNELYVLNTKEHISGYLTYSMIEYENNVTIIKTITITISTLGWVLNKTTVSEITNVEITGVPSSATSGVLTQDQLEMLQSSNNTAIIFNEEKYVLMDIQHEDGFLVFSHVGHDTINEFFIKCITVTISTRAWVLQSIQVNGVQEPVLLWQNPDTTVTFTNQNITLNQSYKNFKYIRIINKYSKSDNIYSAFDSLTIGSSARVNTVSTGANGCEIALRDFTLKSDGNLNVANAYIAVGSSSENIDNDRCIPYQIWGLN